MPSYLLKVSDENGWINPPVVANCENEHKAVKLVQLLVGDAVAVECKGIRPDAMRAALGEIPKGSASFRHDWTWSDDGKEPILY